MKQLLTDGKTSYKIALSAIMVAAALIVSYIEAMIPAVIPIPGVKLGIANIVVVVALYMFGARYALTINVIRIFIAGFLFSGVFGILYSLAGGLLSFAVMLIVKHFKCFSIVGVSLAGGVFHNLGQLLTAAYLVSNIKVFVYFPVLIFSGLICGTVIGIVAGILLQRLKKVRIEGV